MSVSIHILWIPEWHPAMLNALLKCRWKGARLKKNDRKFIHAYVLQHKIPVATGKRKVSIEIVLQKGQRAGDPDAYYKSSLDGLVSNKMLIDDNRQWCDLMPVTFSRNPAAWGTRITLEDIGAAA